MNSQAASAEKFSTRQPLQTGDGEARCPQTLIVTAARCQFSLLVVYAVGWTQWMALVLK